ARFDLIAVVNAIHYKLQSGCRWRLLPIAHVFRGEGPSCIAVFHQYRKWCQKEEWQKIYSRILSQDKSKLDLSISHIDGSHTPVYRGGEKSEYQGRKKRCTTNALFFSDNKGIPLVMSGPQSGNSSEGRCEGKEWESRGERTPYKK
ncbi:transposase, partial [Muribaculaceae bacterium Isolate-001 (NCI)]